MLRFAAALFLLCAVQLPAPAQTVKKPNIIYILADDLGYGDLGSFGQKFIQTPHLDQMAKTGVRFTQHYSGNAVCAPSRCVLMTGKHSGHAYIRTNKEVQPEGQEPIPADTVTLAKLLKQAGYRTGAIGKWGLGMFGSSGDPLRQGFDFFFGYNCQRHAHNHYPKFIYRNDQRQPLEGNSGGATGKIHTQELFEKEALDFIQAHQKGPFFLYLPFTIPHLALQAPESSLAPYLGKFNEPSYEGGKGYLPHKTPRAAYAAMISRMDQTIGKIRTLLKELGLEENTILFFSSDNGPVYAGVGGSDPQFFQSAGILRGFKGSLHEGGIRVPLIVAWPGRIPAGRTTGHISGFQDVLPTLCEIAGIDLPGGIDGLSFLPTLLGQGKQAEHPYLYWEFPSGGGQQAVRMGDWKAIRQGMAKGNLRTELYNLKEDPSQTTDLADKHPEVIARIELIFREAHTPSALFPLPGVDKK